MLRIKNPQDLGGVGVDNKTKALKNEEKNPTTIKIANENKGKQDLL